MTDKPISEQFDNYIIDAVRMRETEMILKNWLTTQFDNNVWYTKEDDGFYDLLLDGKWQEKKLVWSQVLTEILNHIATKQLEAKHES